jgi:hypothetical protein
MAKAGLIDEMVNDAMVSRQAEQRILHLHSQYLRLVKACLDF